jgi:hypothetical protein
VPGPGLTLRVVIVVGVEVMCRCYLLFLFFLSFPSQALSDDELPAFPKARGYGSTTVGGSGRHLETPSAKIFVVNTLRDSGRGSLRECIEAKGPRTCVFEVGGRIQLTTLLRIREPYLTIAGHTAPDPGITLTNNGIRVQTHDVVIQHIQVLYGDKLPDRYQNETDAVTVGGSAEKPAYNVLIDHCSLGWALDEVFTTWAPGTRDITISNSIVAEGLHCAAHPEGCHSKGVLIGEDSTRITFYRNLVANNIDRNPQWKPGTTGEFVNNVVYNWGPHKGWDLFNVPDVNRTGKGAKVNVIGNYYKPGPTSSVKTATVYGKPVAPATRLFLKGNIGPGRWEDSGDEWSFSSISKSLHQSVSPVLTPSGVIITSAIEAFQSVLANSGTRPKMRNAVDKRVITEVFSNTGSFKDCVSGCEKNTGGWPSLPETRHFLDIPSEPMQLASTGYTRLEEWMNGYLDVLS